MTGTVFGASLLFEPFPNPTPAHVKETKYLEPKENATKTMHKRSNAGEDAGP